MCNAATDDTMVWKPKPPKVRCECGAAFAGLRIVQGELGQHVRVGWTGELQGRVFSLTVTIDPPVALAVARAPLAIPVPMACPFCRAPVLYTQLIPCTRPAVTASLELIRSPNQCIVLEVRLRRGREVVADGP